MNKSYPIIVFILLISVIACAPMQSNVIVAGDDEDQDVGLGGTGMLADTGSGLGGTGMSGTGVLGTITGFGSIFVNGVEIEYNDETDFTINGEAADLVDLKIGDVVEVLTVDDNTYTQAKTINLRHEIIGRVDSVEPQTYSFTVHGHSIVRPINNAVLPEVGATVAVSGFRIDEQTIVATRVVNASAEQSLVRTSTELPYKGRTDRWLVQTHVQDGKAAFDVDDVRHVIKLESKTDKTNNDRLGIKLLKLQKTAAGQLQLDSEVDLRALPRGRQTPVPVKQPTNYMMPGTAPAPGTAPRSIQDAIPGSSKGVQSGTVRNMKR